MAIMKRFSIWVLLFLMILGYFPYDPIDDGVNALDEGSSGGITEIELSARGTYLRDDPNQGGVGNTEPPGIVDLQSNGFVPGDKILISFNGQVFNSAGWDSRPIVYNEPEELIGVFSTSNELLSVANAHRVPGAIDVGADVDTGVTFFNEDPHDIPEDFEITPSTGFLIEVPRNARFLFLCYPDSYYPDNVGTISVTIEKDTDGDGLIDSWEIFGIDFDNDGTIDLDLPMLGADWEHKDVFVEGDYMVGFRPNQKAIDDVKAAFANSPVENPDGVDGINLHVIIDESVPAAALLGSFDEFYLHKDMYFGTPDERTDQKTIDAKKLVFRYCLFVANIWLNPPNYTCPGVAEGVPCDDFILAFGAFQNRGSREEQAAVFMHELGHALGLGHGGDSDVNYKPNYLSVMNYAFEFNSWKPNRPLDFSHNKCIDLDEANLDESMGLGYNDVTVWMGPNGTLLTNNGNALDIDWNNSGTIDMMVHLNLNNQPDAPSPAGELLTDHDDWNNLVYRFRGSGLATRSATMEDYHQELTTKEIDEMYKEAEERFGYPPPSGDEEDQEFSMVMVIIVVMAAILAVIILAGVFLLILKIKSRPDKEE